MDEQNKQLDIPISNTREPVIEAGAPFKDRRADGIILTKLNEGDKPP